MRISDWSSDVCSSDLDLRKYDIGSRTQHKIDLMATFTLPHEMTLYASVRGDWNDYDATLGRRAYDTLGGSLQWDWQPSPATVPSAWYGYRSEDRRVGKACVSTC